MDELAFARLCEAAREFDFPYKEGDREISLRFRVPSQPEFLLLVGQVPDESANNMAVLQGVFVPACLVGWSGISYRDLHADGRAAPLPFNKAHIKHVLTRFRKAVLPAFLEIDRRYHDETQTEQVEVKN